jgi:hypothetical protein
LQKPGTLTLVDAGKLLGRKRNLGEPGATFGIWSAVCSGEVICFEERNFPNEGDGKTKPIAHSSWRKPGHAPTRLMKWTEESPPNEVEVFVNIADVLYKPDAFLRAERLSRKSHSLVLSRPYRLSTKSPLYLVKRKYPFASSLSPRSIPRHLLFKGLSFIFQDYDQLILEMRYALDRDGSISS